MRVCVSAGVPARSVKGRSRFRCAVGFPGEVCASTSRKTRCCGRGRPRPTLCPPFHQKRIVFAPRDKKNTLRSCVPGPQSVKVSPVFKAPLAQLDRASDYGSEGCRFNSCEARQRQSQIAGWSSLVARQAHNLKVVGSNPTPATNFVRGSGNGNPFLVHAPPRSGSFALSLQPARGVTLN